jgi:hypothetical protein
MTTDQFWTIIADSRDKSINANGQKLFERLCVLNEKEIIAFDRLWKEHCYQLYTNQLWGVAHLARRGCSEERFLDWRNWIISKGREAFETARDRPDDLVPLIDTEPEAGHAGVVDVISRALRARNSRWEDSMPDHEGLKPPSNASGPDWGTDDDLKPLLPKSHARYLGGDVEFSRPAPVPSVAVETPRPHVSQPPSSRISKEIPVAKSPEKKPWWKVWG